MKLACSVFLHQILGARFRITQTPCCQPPHTYRILVLGDSFTYGLGVAAYQTFTAHLQMILNRRHNVSPFIEVLNVGRPGLNLIEEWALLRQLNSWVEYDLLLLCLSSDDAQPWSKVELARKTETWETSWHNQWSPDSESHFYTRLALKAIFDEQHTKVAVVFYEPSYSDPMPLVALSEMCRELGIPFLDLVTPFTRFRAEQVRVSRVDAHPSPLAHRIAAAEAASFLQPLLPERTTPTVEQLERDLLARVSYYVSGDEGQPSQIVRAYRHLADSLAHIPWVGAQVLAAVEYLRHRLNSYLRTYRYLLAFPHRPYQFNELSEALFRLERYLLLSKMGVSQVKSDALLVVDLKELADAAKECLTQLENLLEVPLFHESENGMTSALIMMIDHLCQETNQHFAFAKAALVSKFREAVAFCQSAIDLVDRNGNFLGAESEAVRLADFITTAIHTLLSELKEIQTNKQDDQRAELLVEVQVPASCSAIAVNLISSYTILYPYAQIYRQIQYMIRDGTCQVYRFDLPEGTIGFVHLELEFRYSVREEGVRDGEEYIKSIMLELGTHRRSYKPGELLYSPLPELGS